MQNVGKFGFGVPSPAPPLLKLLATFEKRLDNQAGVFESRYKNFYIFADGDVLFPIVFSIEKLITISDEFFGVEIFSI